MKTYISPSLRVIVLCDTVISTSSRMYTSFGDAAQNGDEGCVSARRGMEDYENY